MRRALPLILFLIPVLVTGLFCSRREVRPLPDDTNLVLVVVDTLRRHRLGVYGGPAGLTPFLNRLSRDCIRFRHAVAPSSWTKPSVASLMTGLYPSRHGAVGITRGLERYSGSPALALGRVTLAEMLHEEGLATAAFVTNVHISVNNNFHQGFDHFVQPAGHADELLTRALDWLDGREAGGRFFLYLHLLDPHTPYEPPEPFRSRFADPDPPGRGPFSQRGWPFEMDWWSEQYRWWLDGSGGKPFLFNYDRFNLIWARQHFPELDDPEFSYVFENMEQFEERVDLGFSGPDDPDLARRIDVLTSLYDGEVAWVDQQLAALFDGLENRGLLSRSVVVFTSDHGEAFMEHHTWGHHRSLYGEEVNIPLLLRVPDGRGGLLRGEVEPAVSLVDLYPTVMEMFGLPLRDGIDGVSLWPAIRDGRDEALRKRPVYSELLLDNREYVGVLLGRRKLIRTVDEKQRVRWEQFNVGGDPGERNPAANRADGPPAHLLRAGLEAFVEGRELNTPNDGDPARLSAEELERLGALGYLAREEEGGKERPSRTP